VSERDREASTMRGPCPTSCCSAMGEKKLLISGGSCLTPELNSGGYTSVNRQLIHSTGTFPYVIPLVCYDSTPFIFPTPRKYKNSHGIPYIVGEDAWLVWG
jgi:hypothetical protein